ncbi:hypothetical protein L6164_035808 [Bauhinia variegata]|uniref:Uncharacterized protein n=1 Tax=Bauhinia variegata TaxID=167791 RepID=A0ACB9KF76_BAUVA|nr:hypothetical protein L6164_035808 [Bauhinia variegata]
MAMEMEKNRTVSIEEGGKDSKYDDDGRIKRTGTWLTASAHIVTAVIGSGVLSLAWAMAQLGWIAGIVALVIFSIITLYTSSLLADCYRSPDPIHGERNPTYIKMVKNNLGGMKYKLCGLAQYVNLVGISIGYTITASISMVALKRSNCFHKNGHDVGCHLSNNPYMITFGAIQILLSQIPDFQELSFLSVVAAVMSFGYSLIGVGLAIAKVAGGNLPKTSLTGTVVGVDVTSKQKLWNTFQAIGDIAFAYAFSMVMVEIEDTLKSSPPENKSMKKATFVGVVVTTLFYMLCGVLGYAAFGNKAPGNFLTGFGFYEPFWLVDIGNIFIIIHLVGAYQVFVQPIFGLVENWCRKCWPDSTFMNKEYPITTPLIGIFRLNFFRIIWRTCFVVFTTLIAMIVPFFNSILGLLGAISFWPLTVYFPIEMYISRTRMAKFSPTWVALKMLTGFCLIITLLAAAGSIEGIVKDLGTFKPFKSTS